MNDDGQKPKTWMKILGFFVIGAAIVLIIVAAVDFFTAIADFGIGGRGPRLFWMFFIAFPMLVAGSLLIKLGSARKNIDGAGGNIVHTGSLSEPPNAAPKKCPYCGRLNPSDALACAGCGANLDK
ncbi:hypothetical protein FACS1894211_08330 [Clostridia bacterium]|nr:hypothetical protein FACS1894211_08330 [Clostridia bacterium]